MLYCRVAAEPYVSGADAVADPSMERMPLTVTPVIVLIPDPENVRLL